MEAMDRSREKKSLWRRKKIWISAHELVKERLKNLKVKLPINGQIGLFDAKIGRQNPQFYEVLEGLMRGDKVITSGCEMFGDNERMVFK